MAEPRDITPIVADILKHPDGALQGKEVIELFEKLLHNSVNWGGIGQTVDFEWSPDRIEYIYDHLDDERIEELEAGAELNEQEKELWEDQMGMLLDGSDVIDVYFVSLPAYEPFWYTLTGDSCGQGATTFGAAGPFRTQESLMDYLVSNVAGAYGWAGFSSMPEMDPIIEMLESRTTNRDPEFKNMPPVSVDE